MGQIVPLLKRYRVSGVLRDLMEGSGLVSNSANTASTTELLDQSKLTSQLLNLERSTGRTYIASLSLKAMAYVFEAPCPDRTSSRALLANFSRSVGLQSSRSKVGARWCQLFTQNRPLSR